MKWDYNTLSNGSQIEIHNLKKVNLKGGILIDGFPKRRIDQFNTFDVFYES